MTSRDEHNESNKRDRIFQACQDRDVDLLRQFASSEGGLVDDEVRRTACMFLSPEKRSVKLRNFERADSVGRRR